MSDTNLNNIPILTVGKTVDLLAKAFCAAISRDVSPKLLPSVMLWGPPGVGKSQAIRQVAERITGETGKRAVVTDVRLMLFNPIDLRGIPTANADKTLAIWLKPQIFQMDESENVVNLLFLDEISAAPQSVQAAAYQITLDRVIGEHKLPDNCFVIAAGNRVTDKSVAFKMPRALANRLLHIQVEGNFSSWKQWAIPRGIHPKVLGYLTFRPDRLDSGDPKADDLAFATPRTWEMVSNLLYSVSEDEDEMFHLIAGLVGNGAAVEFRTWAKVYRQIPSMEDVFDGRKPPIPRGTDTLYALAASMTAYARAHKEELNRVANAAEYANRMPPDFSAMLLKDFMYLEEGYREKLLGIPAFSRWLSEKGRLLNGSVGR